MARIVITGGGVSGLVGAMALAKDGHDVTLLERDAAEPPEPTEAWDHWERKGVTQFRLLHFFTQRFRQELERELPEVIPHMEAAGALRINPLAGAPDELTGGARPSDTKFDALTGRRPVMEAALGAAAVQTPGLTVRRGVAVQGFITGTSAMTGVPHVTGVKSDSGEEISADLVVDATGRRSSLPKWLTAAGARPVAEELEDVGFIYFGRHFRSADGSTPPIMGGLLMPHGSISTLTLPADNGTWGVGVIASASDKAMRAVRNVDTWNAVMKSLPLVAHWIDGEPLEDSITVMAKIEDRHRAFVVDGTPLATGVVAMADSWACTNPSLGRGATLGTLHALALRDLMRDDPLDDPAAFAMAWHDTTERVLDPWYRATAEFDRHRLQEIQAIVEGRPYRPEGEYWDTMQGLQFAAGQDGDCLRAVLDIFGLLRPEAEVLAEASVSEKIRTLGADWRDAPTLGPDRAGLLSIVAD